MGGFIGIKGLLQTADDTYHFFSGSISKNQSVILPHLDLGSSSAPKKRAQVLISMS